MHSRLPPGFTSLIVCDTRRAEEWRDALRREGFEATMVETAATETRGAWEVGVADRWAMKGRAFVSEVTQGKRRLTRGARWSTRAVVLLLVVGVVVWVYLRASTS